MEGRETVIVVDPDGVTREAVGNLASKMYLECEAYASGEEFLCSYDPSRPGCAVLEVTIPGIDGLELQKRIASDGPGLPVIFLTGEATVSIAVRAMRAGAVHFLEKPLRENELWDAIRESLERDRERRRVRVQHQKLDDCLAQLTSKEQHVLKMIAEGKPKTVIARDMGVCVRTTEMYKARMIRKLGLKIPDQLVRFAMAVHNGDGHDIPGVSSE